MVKLQKTALRVVFNYYSVDFLSTVEYVKTVPLLGIQLKALLIEVSNVSKY